MGFLRSSTFNLLFFNLLWLSCVLGRNELLWLSAPAILGYAGYLLATETIRASSLLAPALSGITIDTVLVSAGLMDFYPHTLLPAWLLMLWLLFATTLSLSLSWLQRRFWISALAGGLAFPLNYRLGEEFGAVDFTAPMPLVMALMAAVWMVGLPLLFWLSNAAGRITLLESLRVREQAT